MKFLVESSSRRGSIDIWNAFMVKDATFTENDIPICESTDTTPDSVISFVEAKSIYQKEMRNNPDFKDSRFVHFYIDDQKFDGEKTGIWYQPWKAMKMLNHFKGIITPDFSTNCDFPYPLKIWNTYRMRAFGCWSRKQGLEVINNVRWGTEETWDYCFDGIPKGSIVSVGTVASGLQRVANRNLFSRGFEQMIKVIEPSTVIIYGSSNLPVIVKATEFGTKIISFPSETSLYFKGEKCHE